MKGNWEIVQAWEEWRTSGSQENGRKFLDILNKGMEKSELVYVGGARAV